MAFDIRTARPVTGLPARNVSSQNKGRFDISTARPVSIETRQEGSIPLSISAFGPLGRGEVAAQRGAKLQDLLYLISKSFSGLQ